MSGSSGIPGNLRITPAVWQIDFERNAGNAENAGNPRDPGMTPVGARSRATGVAGLSSVKNEKLTCPHWTYGTHFCPIGNDAGIRTWEART